MSLAIIKRVFEIILRVTFSGIERSEIFLFTIYLTYSYSFPLYFV
ncbi:hypothetical protein N186_00180 [Thermofilum adornatum]|uniref:Uncharacterized protein n=1 Tax=Thermofilum adornatum TaxID=1365176 RepID=S5ZU38_9CREN|nr:hypothetical protein N186_00180 [Thermofilum adornatum]